MDVLFVIKSIIWIMLNLHVKNVRLITVSNVIRISINVIYVRMAILIILLIINNIISIVTIIILYQYHHLLIHYHQYQNNYVSVVTNQYKAVNIVLLHLYVYHVSMVLTYNMTHLTI